MKRRGGKRMLKNCAALGLFMTGLGSAWAAPIELTANSLNMFRDNRGLNDVGTTPGDFLQYGANIRGGSLGTSLGAFYGPQSLTDPAVECSPLLTNANFCSNS